MTNQTINPVLPAALAALIQTTPAAEAVAAPVSQWNQTTGEALSNQRKLEALGRKDELKRKDKLPSRSALIAADLVRKMESEASLFCPLSGLVAPAGGLPAHVGYYMTAYHPLAFNCWAICDQPAYVAKLSNEHLAGLVLACLNDLGKINYGRGDKATNAYLIRAKLEVVCNRNRLLDLLEWIQNSLGQTTIYYPPFQTNHKDLTLQSLQDWMDWTYSIEVYAFEGSEATPIKQPKTLAPVSADTQIKRLNSSLFGSWTTLLLEQEGWLSDAFVAKAAKYSKTLATAAPVVERMLAALMAQAEEAGCAQAIEEAADFISEVEEARELAASIQAKQLDDDWGTSQDEPAADATASQAREAFIAKMKAAKEASLAANQTKLTTAKPTPAPTAKQSFLELLAARKAAAQDKTND